MEKTFLKEEGVEVTSARLIVGDAVYAMSKVVGVEKVKWNSAGMYALVALCLALVLVGAFVAGAGGTAMLWGAAVIMAGVWGVVLTAKMWRRLKHAKSVDVWVGESGRFSVFWSQDDAAVDRVYRAISEAIAANANKGVA